MIDSPRGSHRARMLTCWTVLGVGALLKAAVFGWFGWLSWFAASVSRGLAAMMHEPPPPPRPLSQVVLGALVVAGILGIAAGVFGIILAALQRVVLGRSSGEPLVKLGWIDLSGATAALVTFGWMFACVVWNNLDGPRSLAGVIAELLAGSILEVWAIVSVQRRLLARARCHVPHDPA